MPMQIKALPLVLPGDDSPKLRYTPLAALAVADYVNDYLDHLGQTGVFDYLSTSGAGIDLDDVRRMDLAALGVVGSSFSRLLSGDGGVERKRLSTIALDHADRFKVQAWDAANEDWVSLATADAFNAYLRVEHLLDLVKILGGEALRPLSSRLFSRGEERPGGSVQPSPEISAES